MDAKTRKSWRTRVKNGMIVKSKRHRNVRCCRKDAEFTSDVKEEKEEIEAEKVEEGEEKQEQDDDPRSFNSSCSKTSLQNDEQDYDDDVAVENIAERIKKRKVNVEKKMLKPTETESDTSSKRSTKKRVLSERRHKSPGEDQAVVVSSSRKDKRLDNTSKRRRMRATARSTAEKSELSTNAIIGKMIAAPVSKRSTRAASSTKISKGAAGSESNCARDRYNSKFSYDSPPESCDETEECLSDESNVVDSHVDEKHDSLSDEEVIKEQQRIEQMHLQEREDYELARRLQAEYDEIEQVARRTRRSRRVGEGASFDPVELREIAAVRTARRARRAPAKPLLVVRTAKTVPKKKRGRPPKRVK